MRLRIVACLLCVLTLGSTREPAAQTIRTGSITVTVTDDGQRVQGPSVAPTAMRTAWGDPDLQGIWNTSGAAPLERPDRYAGRESLTDKELQLLREQAQDREEGPPRPGDPGTYNRFWVDTGPPSRQTSLVVDPPDGKLPALTPEGRAAAKTRVRGADTWEDRHLWERCITRGGLPNAMLPRAYNNNTQIFQAPGYVVLLLEQIHEPRIIPLDGRPHVSSKIRQWLGDSRGHWEGDTLVVETRHFADKVSGLQPWANFSSTGGSGERLHIVERFTRSDANTLAYRMTVTDPLMYTTPWTVAFPMRKTQELMYEYACHEGNYGMEGILSGARAQESAAGKATKP
jgi:hypothetical protein